MVWAAVALGGALGSLSRWACSLWVAAFAGSGFPLTTLSVNVAGSFLLGLLQGTAAERWQNSPLYHGLGAGVIGSFTTMSALGVETWMLFVEGRWGTALLYVGLSALFGPLFAIYGLNAGKRGFKEGRGSS